MFMQEDIAAASSNWLALMEDQSMEHLPAVHPDECSPYLTRALSSQAKPTCQVSLLRKYDRLHMTSLLLVSTCSCHCLAQNPLYGSQDNGVCHAHHSQV